MFTMNHANFIESYAVHSDINGPSNLTEMVPVLFSGYGKIDVISCRNFVSDQVFS